MKSRHLILLFALPLFLGVGCDSKSTTTVVMVTCDYDGKTYDTGSVRAAEDACNACTCGEHGWSCTKLACKPSNGGPTGIIKGSIALPPGEQVGSVQVCAEPVSGSDIRCTAVPTGETAFALQVPLGRWWLYATVPGDSAVRKAYWTEAVKCGLGSECVDHSLIMTHVEKAEDSIVADPKDWDISGRVQAFGIMPSKRLDKVFYYEGSMFSLTTRAAESVEILHIPFPGEATDPPTRIGWATLKETDKDGLQTWTLPVPPDLNARDVWANIVGTDGMSFRWKSLGWVENEKTLHPVEGQ